MPISMTLFFKYLNSNTFYVNIMYLLPVQLKAVCHWLLTLQKTEWTVEPVVLSAHEYANAQVTGIHWDWVSDAATANGATTILLFVANVDIGGQEFVVE